MGRPKKQFQSSAEDKLQVLKAHESLSIPGACTSMSKTMLRMHAWHKKVFTIAKVRFILQECQHNCEHYDAEIPISLFETLVSRIEEPIFFLDQRRKLEFTWTLVQIGRKGKRSISMQRTLSGAVLAAASQGWLPAKSFLFHDQAPDLNILDVALAKVILQMYEVQLWIHPYGMNWNLHKAVERAHPHKATK